MSLNSILASALEVLCDYALYKSTFTFTFTTSQIIEDTVMSVRDMISHRLLSLGFETMNFYLKVRKMPFVLSNLHKTSRTYDSFILHCIGKKTVLLYSFVWLYVSSQATH